MAVIVRFQLYDSRLIDQRGWSMSLSQFCVAGRTIEIESPTFRPATESSRNHLAPTGTYESIILCWVLGTFLATVLPATLIAGPPNVPASRRIVPVGPSPAPRRTTPLVLIVIVDRSSWTPGCRATAPRKPSGPSGMADTLSTAAWIRAAASPVAAGTVTFVATDGMGTPPP